MRRYAAFTALCSPPPCLAGISNRSRRRPPPTPLPADSWPRDISPSNAALLVHQPWYAGGGVAGTTFSGSYATARGTTGDINAGRQYNAWTGNATRGYDRTFDTAAGASGNVARASNYNPHRPALERQCGLGHGSGRKHVRPCRLDDGRTGRQRARRWRLDVQRPDPDKTNTWGTASVGYNHYADV